MTSDAHIRRVRSEIEDLRAMRDLARREHGPQGRSTRMLQQALDKAERDHAGASGSSAPQARAAAIAAQAVPKAP